MHDMVVFVSWTTYPALWVSSCTQFGLRFTLLLPLQMLLTCDPASLPTITPCSACCCVLLLCACSPTGSARQVLSSLSDALPWQSYMSLQKHLMAKGLIRELEVPAEFE